MPDKKHKYTPKRLTGSDRRLWCVDCEINDDSATFVRAADYVWEGNSLCWPHLKRRTDRPVTRGLSRFMTFLDEMNVEVPD